MDKRSALVKSMIMAILVLPAAKAAGEDIFVSSADMSTEISVGTTSAFAGIAFEIILEDALPEGVLIDRGKFEQSKNSMPDFELRDQQDQKSYKFDKSGIGAADTFISTYIGSQGIDGETLAFLSKSGTYIHIDRDLLVPLTNDDVLVIMPDELKKTAFESLPAEDTKLLIEAKGGEHTLYQNKIDFGVRADKPDSVDLEFVLSFRYFGKPLALLPDWWKAHASGYFSTVKNDSLSELRLFPISIGRIWGLEKANPLSTFELRANMGIEGDQSMRFARLNAQVYYTTLFPNLIDLTGGMDRLRLKPVIRLGAELWREMDDDGMMQANETAGKLGGEIYYFIPIHQSYSLLVEGDLGVPYGQAYKEKYGVDDVINRFDLTLGYHLAGGNIKVMAKYSLGENDILYKNASKLFLGLIVDFLEMEQGSL